MNLNKLKTKMSLKFVCQIVFARFAAQIAWTLAIMAVAFHESDSSMRSKILVRALTVILPSVLTGGFFWIGLQRASKIVRALYVAYLIFIIYSIATSPFVYTVFIIPSLLALILLTIGAIALFWGEARSAFRAETKPPFSFLAFAYSPLPAIAFTLLIASLAVVENPLRSGRMVASSAVFKEALKLPKQCSETAEPSWTLVSEDDSKMTDEMKTNIQDCIENGKKYGDLTHPGKTLDEAKYCRCVNFNIQESLKATGLSECDSFNLTQRTIPSLCEEKALLKK